MSEVAPTRLTREQVTHVAWLARLSLTDAEVDLYAEQLSGILGHIDRLLELDVDDIPPTAMAVEAAVNIVRPDLPRPSWPQHEVVANAADVDEGSFRVRAILEETQ
jgi:aspartyl-tRNA(Asn)/glutamyl-tRNA(Gln) amidotransferase subunit C